MSSTSPLASSILSFPPSVPYSFTHSSSLSSSQLNFLKSSLAFYTVEVLSFGQRWNAILLAEAVDPSCVLIQCLCSDYYMAASDLPTAIQHLNKARALRSQGLANPRELSIIAAYECLLESFDAAGAFHHFWSALTHCYSDLFMVKRAQGCGFGQGAPLKMLEVTENPEILKACDNLPLFHSIRAFSLEENGLFREARDAGLRALEISSDDVWAVHALVHALSGTKEFDTGVELVKKHEQLFPSRLSFMFTHFYFHYGLFLLELEKFSAVPQVFEACIWKDEEPLNEPDGPGSLSALKPARPPMHEEFLGISLDVPASFRHQDPFHVDDQEGAMNFIWKWEIRLDRSQFEQKPAFRSYCRQLIRYLSWPFEGSRGLYCLLLLRTLAGAGEAEAAARVMNNIRVKAAANREIEQSRPNPESEPFTVEYAHYSAYLPIAESVFEYYTATAAERQAPELLRRLHDRLEGIFLPWADKANSIGTPLDLELDPNFKATESKESVSSRVLFTRAIGGSAEQRGVVEDYWRLLKWLRESSQSNPQ